MSGAGGFEAAATQIVEAAPDALLLVDHRGRILVVNRQTEVLFGYDRADLVGNPVEILVPEKAREVHEQHRAEYVESPRTRAMGAAQRLRGRRRDGKTFPVEVSLSPIHTADEVLIVAAVRDVTERQRADEVLTETRRKALLLEDRERVARDLHDTVIQELFATGMQLQASIPAIDDEGAAERVADAVDAIDDTIRQIRETIFGLTGLSDTGHGPRDKIEAIVSTFTDALGFEPALEFTGEVEQLPAPIADHLVPTVREALSNAARHARASDVRVVVDVRDEEISLEVVDDGIGIVGAEPGPGRGSGLQNMQDRAVALGGAFVVEARRGGGTRLEWRVPRKVPRRVVT